MRLLALLSCTIWLGACSCQRQPQADAAVTATVERAAVTTAAGSVGTAADVARAERTQQQRLRAITEAVDTLHGYLRELGSGQLEQAEKRWAYHRSPSVDAEAGLRSHDNLLALRIHSGTPKPLDAEPVPIYIEIPVELHASLGNGEVNRYQGWYRLRHNPVTTQWELTAASVSPLIR